MRKFRSAAVPSRSTSGISNPQRLGTAALLPNSERREQLLEMQLLPSVGDVDDFVRLPRFQTIRQRGQIRRRVIETAVALADERGTLLQLRIVVEENGNRAFAFAGDAHGQQFIHE